MRWRLAHLSTLVLTITASSRCSALSKGSRFGLERFMATTTSSSSFAKAPQAMSATEEERVELVDESNNVIPGGVNRSEMRANRLVHRASYAFVRNSDNYFYVQKRSSRKDYCPSYFDPTPGGVVACGESYEETNRRECAEEMGIPETTPQQHLFTFYYQDERLRCWGDAWECVYDGPLRLQESEVESVHLMSMQEILQRFDAGELFTPDSVAACREYVKLRGLLPVKEGVPPKEPTFY